MNIKDIEDSIVELEQGSTTFVNCQKLAALYICKEHMKDGLESTVERQDSITESNVTKELNDILPQYKNYVETRRNYQMHKADKKEVLRVLSLLCQEVSEFITALYVETESAEEHEILQSMMENLKNF